MDRDTNYGDPTQKSVGDVKQTECTAMAGRVPSTAKTYDQNGEALVNTVQSWAPNGGGSSKGTCTLSVQKVIPVWHYAQHDSDLGQYAKGFAVQDPSKYVDFKRKWQGCVEERKTVAATSFNQNSLPPDLDPDLPPTNMDTKWKPMWPEQIYNRYATYLGYSDKWSDDQLPNKASRSGLYRYLWNTGGDPEYMAAGQVSCGKAVQRLKTMSRSEVSAYLNAPEFKPLGGTYHDVGMMWGTRFISPTGPFAADTAAWPGRSTPNRHIIFMTDGEMKPNADIYGAYGIERYDGRVGGGDVSEEGLKARHNARFRAICEAAKSPRNVTVWVIAFGEELNDDLRACATQPSSQYAIFAASTNDLRAAFRRIAKQVASLRVYR